MLITGGAGFVGAALARRCLARGDEVHVLVRAGTALDRLRPVIDDIGVHRCDLGDRAAIDGCLAAVEPDEIYHLAVATRSTDRADLADATDSVRDLDNLMTLVAAMTAARRPPRVLVRSGSAAEYGLLPTPYRETQREAPASAYAASLLAGTQYLEMLRPRLPFRALTARLALIYGPGQSEAFFIPQSIRRVLAGEPMTLRRPRDRRDLIHIGDAVDGLLALAAAPVRDTSFVNIASGIAPTMAEVADLIIAAAGADPGLVRREPQPIAPPVSDLRACPVLAQRWLGWQARIPIAEGLAQTVAAIAGDRVLADCGA